MGWYTANNPLTYILMTAKLDAASHQWVGSLANYNFWLNYQARKTNVEVDALLRVSWLGCMPGNSGTHLQVTAAAVHPVQGAALEGLHKPHRGIQLWSACPGLNAGQSACHLYDWKTGIRPRRMIQPCIWSFLDCRMEPWGNDSLNRQSHLSSVSCYVKEITSCYEKVSCTEEPHPRELEDTLFQLVCQLYTKKSL